MIPIGSHEAVLRQLTSRFLEGRNNCICVLDGDQRTGFESAKSKIAKYSEASTQPEKDVARNWGAARICYLPGTEWPEKWLLETAIEYSELAQLLHAGSLVEDWGLTDTDELLAFLRDALQVGKHKEFYKLGELVELEMSRVRSDIIIAVKKALPDSIDDLEAIVNGFLDV